MANSVTVTIGRNIGHKPMPDAQWRTFQASVRHALSVHTYATPSVNGDPIVEEHHGIGTWDGIEEESSKISITGYDLLDSAGLRAALAQLAHINNQDAVALTIGTAHLIPGY